MDSFIGTANLDPSSSARWYVALSLALVNTYGPNHLLANFLVVLCWLSSLMSYTNTQSPSLIFLGILFFTRAASIIFRAFSRSSGLLSSCLIRIANNSSRLISFSHGISIHEAIVFSMGITGFCPYISSVGIYPFTELYVVLSAHKA